MKKNSLTTAVVAGIAGVAGFAGLASAVELNADGLGQVLIYPYYTVNKNQDTLLSVVNTTDVGKAVKVRFLEGYNSREVLDFNLFLSPYDVWTARVSTNGAGAGVSSTDTSCTWPALNGSVPFRAAAYAGGSTFPADSGPQGVDRTREGYVELIEMGEIIPGSPLDATTTHAQNGNPNEGEPACGSAIQGTTPGGYLSNPGGGLFGAGSIVNVGDGTLFAYNADAIDGFSDDVLFSGPSGLTPSLLQANNAASAFGGAVAYVFANGSLLTLDYSNGIDAVSAVFLSDAIYNEYLVSGDIGANSDWVVTFPTKRFYVDEYYVGATAVQPFVDVFRYAPANDGTSFVEVGINLFDQEEGFTDQPDDFSPPIAEQPSSLPYEVNVISFLTETAAEDPSGVLGSNLRANIVPYGDAGWLKLDLASGDGGHAMVPADNNGYVLHGLPATGFYAYNVINANAAPGKLANYNGLFRHRASRVCTVDNGAACS